MSMLCRLLRRTNPFRTPHLAVVYVEYAKRNVKTADQPFAILQQYLASLTGWRITYLRVDNKDESRPLTKTGNHSFSVGGDNSSHEFSGWQRGISVLASLPCHYDLLLIINDMFLKPGPSFLQDYATPALLEKSVAENKIIGRIDSTSQDYRLFGFDVSSWICTNCVLIPKQAVDALGDFALIKDKIHQIFPHSYDPRHLIRRDQCALETGSGDFRIEYDLPAATRQEIRIKFNSAATGHKTSPPSGGHLPAIMIKAITINNQPFPEEWLIRGLMREQGVSWAGQSLLLGLSEDRGQPCRLAIKGCLPPSLRQEYFSNAIEIVAYNDALLYQPDAPINNAYQRWIVEWLTEKWHSRFEINQATWELFTTKATAIFNEALLTAKFRALGFSPEAYGDKYYY